VSVKIINEKVRFHQGSPVAMSLGRRLVRSLGALGSVSSGRASPSDRLGRTGSSAYLAEPVLVPEGADDERHEPPFLKPAEGELRTQAQKVANLIQVERTVPGDGYEGWRGMAVSTARGTEGTRTPPQHRWRGEVGCDGEKWHVSCCQLGLTELEGPGMAPGSSSAPPKAAPSPPGTGPPLSLLIPGCREEPSLPPRTPGLALGRGGSNGPGVPE